MGLPKKTTWAATRTHVRPAITREGSRHGPRHEHVHGYVGIGKVAFQLTKPDKLMSLVAYTRVAFDVASGLRGLRGLLAER